MKATVQLGNGFVGTATGLQVSGNPSAADWQEAGARIRAAGSGHQWWIGDWLAYGEGRGDWGEMYKEAEQILGIANGTLRNYKYVSEHVNLSLRNDKLTWDHHRFVAPRPVAEQRGWLKKAVDENWSARELQQAIQQAAMEVRQAEAAAKIEEAGGTAETIEEVFAEEEAEEDGNQPTSSQTTAAQPAQPKPSPVRSGLFPGDFRTILPSVPSGTVDLILTDPPYDTESIPLYLALAEHAARVLKDGGSLVTFAPHYALGEVITGMAQHLRFWWTLAVRHTGGNRRFPGKWVFVGWKPMLWFVKGHRANKEFIADFIESKDDFTAEDNGRQLHHWQQSSTEAEYLIQHLAEPGGLVLDPMCGSGTNCLAAAKLGRVYIGIDIEQKNVDVAKVRIHDNDQVGAA